MTPNPASVPLPPASAPPELLLALSGGSPSGADLVLAHQLGLVKITANSWWLSVSGDAALATLAVSAAPPAAA